MRYLAPEQAEGRDVGPEADVYSLGVVLDELLDSTTPRDVALLREMPRPNRRRGPPRPTSPPSSVRRRRCRARRRRRPARRRIPRAALLAAGAAGAIVAAGAIAFAEGSGGGKPARIEPVPQAATPAQQARNISAWLKRYSR